MNSKTLDNLLNQGQTTGLIGTNPLVDEVLKSGNKPASNDSLGPYKKAGQTNPQREADKIIKARDLSISPSSVDHRQEDVDARVMQKRVNALPENSRRVVQDNIKLASDDLDAIEQNATDWQNTWYDDPVAYLQQTDWDNIGSDLKDIYQTIIPLTADFANETVNSAYSFLNDMSGGTLDMAGGAFEDLSESLIGWDGTFEYEKPEQRLGFKDIANVKDDPIASAVVGVPYALSQFVISSPEMLMWPVTPLARADQMAKERAQNNNDEASLKDKFKALPLATITMLADRFSFKKVLGLKGNDAKGSVIREGGEAALAEAATEAFQEGVQNAYTTIGTERGFDRDEFIDRIYEATITGGVAGGVIRLGTAKYQKHMAERREEKIKEINAQPSKLRDRLPEKYAEVQEAAMKDAGVEKIKLSPEGVRVLNQSLMEATQNVSHNTKKEIEQKLSASARSAQLGHGVDISPKEFWALPKETIDAIAEHVTFAEGELTKEEADQVEELVTAQMDEFVNEASKIYDVESKVFDNVYRQLIQAGNTPEAARPKAQQMASVFQTLTERSGVDGERLVEHFLPTIKKTLPELFSEKDVGSRLDVVKRTKELLLEDDQEPLAYTDQERDESRAVLEFAERNGIDFDQEPEAITEQLARLDYTPGAREMQDEYFADVSSPQFKEWFGDSKIVNEDGSPKVLYRGLSKPYSPVYLERFVYSERFFFRPIFLTDDEQVADGYAEADVSREEIEGEEEILSVYAKIENPFVIDADGSDWDDIRAPDNYPGQASYLITDDIAKWAKDKGHDGVIFENIHDRSLTYQSNEFPSSTTYVVFDENQIKHVKNKGTFNPANRNIYYQSNGEQNDNSRPDSPRPRIAARSPSLEEDGLEEASVTGEEGASPATGTGQGTADAEVLRPEQKVYYQGEAQRNNIGMYSAVEQTVLDIVPKIGKWKNGEAASGKEIWQNLKSKQSYKAEEIEWLGLEEYLTTGEQRKFSLDEVLAFIRNNGVRVEEIVADRTSYKELFPDSLEEIDIYGNEDQIQMLSYLDEEFEGGEYGYEDFQNNYIERRMEEVSDENIDEDDLRDNLLEEFEENIVEYSRKYKIQRVYTYNTKEDETEYDEVLFEIIGNNDGWILFENTFPIKRSEEDGDEKYLFNDIDDAQDFAKAYIAKRDDTFIDPEDEDGNYDDLVHWDEYIYKNPGTEFAKTGQDLNYKELKFTLPDVPGSYLKEGHNFQSENIVAFIRSTDRQTRADGGNSRRSFFIEEMQSDWHRDGMKFGYQGEFERTIRKHSVDDILSEIEIMDFEGYAYSDLFYNDIKQIVDSDEDNKKEKLYNVVDNVWKEYVSNKSALPILGKLYEERNRNYSEDLMPPNAPFKKDGWLNLAIKRAISFAVENGYDSVSWANSQILQDRWSEDYKDLYDMQYDKKMPGAFKKLTGQKPTFNYIVPDEEYVMKDPKEERYTLGIDEREAFEYFIGAAITEAERLIKVSQKEIEESPEKKEATNHAIKNLETIIYSSKKAKEDLDNRAEKNQLFIVDRLYTAIATRSYGLFQKLLSETATALPQGFKILEDHISLYEKLEKRYKAGYRKRTDFSGYWEIVITDELREAVKTKGFALFQDTEKNRGSIDLSDLSDITINLFKNEDMSTFLHESGHLYLEMVAMLANEETATQQLKDDYQTILDYLGVRSYGEIGVEQHEKFAESYEKYLMEGKAPSLKLAQAFSKFTAWLTQLYKRMIGAGSLKRGELNDAIRGVFDRMLATDQEISDMQDMFNINPVFKDMDSAGLSQEEFDKYARDYEELKQSQKAELLARAIKETKVEQRGNFEKELAEEERAVLSSLDYGRDWTARYALQEGRLPSGAPAILDVELKLSRQAVKSMEGYSDDWRLPGGNKIFAADGYHPDDIAPMLGYNSGDELVRELLDMPKDDKGRFLNEKQYAKRKARANLQERYGDMMLDGSIQEKAIETIHSRKQAYILESEIKHLSKITGRDKSASTAVLREAAKRIIANGKVSDTLSNRKYLNAEIKAAREAMLAIKKGDTEAAYQAKQVQVLNFHLYREALRQAEAIDRQASKLRRWQSKPIDPKRVNPDFIKQIKQLLEHIDFGSKVGLKRFSRLSSETLERWGVEQGEKYGARFHIPAELDRALTKDNYRDMSVAELSALYDTANSIVYQGRRYSDAMDAQFKSMAAKLAASIEQNATKVVPEKLERGFLDKMGAFGRLFLAEHRQIHSLAKELDGYADRGLVYTTLYRPIKRADDRYIDRSMKASKELNDILNKYTQKEKLRFYRRKEIDGIEGGMSLSARLAFALNMGNAGNVDAIRAEFSDAQIEAVLDSLTDKDWDVVEAIWAHVDSYWPDLSALEERATGVKPPKVEPSPFITSSGRAIKGGYFPLIADPERGSQGEKDFEERQSLNGFMQGGHAKASTKHGSTIQRKGFGNERRVWLDLAVVFQHVDGVIKDIEMREAVVDVHRFLNNAQVSGQIKGAKGNEFYKMFGYWLQNVIGNNRQPTTAMEKIVSYGRAGVSIAEMGLSVRTVLQQPFGLTQSMAMLGEGNVMKGVAEFTVNPIKASKKVMAASAFMRNRAATFNRDVKDAQRLLGAKNLHDKVVAASFYGIQALDLSVSVPTWIAAHNKALNKGMRGQAAIDYADEAVSRSQGSGLPRELSDIQQGNVWKKMFTMFYTFFNAYYNLQTDMYKQTDFKSPAQALKYAKNQVWVTVIPALLVDHLFNGGADEGDEELPVWAIKSLLGYMGAGLTGIRDVANAVTSGFGYQISPLGNIAKSGAELAKDVASGEMDARSVKLGIMLASYLLHLPSGRTLTRGTDYLMEEGTKELDTFEGWWRFTVQGRER